MEKVMCKQKGFLEAIKKTRGRGGMTPAQIELAEAQCEDYRDLKQEVVEIKKTAEETKSELEYIRGQVDILVKESQNKNGFVLALEIIRTKSFWTFATVVSVIYLCGKYNINPVEVIGHFFGHG